MKDTHQLLKNIKQLFDEFEKMVPGISIGGHPISILFDRYPSFKQALSDVRKDLEDLTKET